MKPDILSAVVAKVRPVGKETSTRIDREGDLSPRANQAVVLVTARGKRPAIWKARIAASDKILIRDQSDIEVKRIESITDYGGTSGDSRKVEIEFDDGSTMSSISPLKIEMLYKGALKDVLWRFRWDTSGSRSGFPKVPARKKGDNIKRIDFEDTYAVFITEGDGIL